MSTTSISPAVLAKFQTAKASIEKTGYQKQVSPFDVILKGWSSTDRSSFLKWFVSETQLALQKEIVRQSQLPAATTAQYISAVNVLDLRDSEAIGKFVSTTQYAYWNPLPKPIPLGRDDNILYRLSCVNAYDDFNSDLGEGVKSHPYILELRSTLATTMSPLQYFLPLGLLDAIVSPKASTTTTTATTSSAPTPTPTPFIVCLSAVDKSLWLLLRQGPTPISATTNTWDLLPASKPVANRPSFDLMQIFKASEFAALTESKAADRMLFSDAVLATAKSIVPVPYLAADNAVGKIVGLPAVVPVPATGVLLPKGAQAAGSAAA